VSRPPIDPFDFAIRALLVSWIAGCGKAPEYPRRATPSVATPQVVAPTPSSAPGSNVSFTAFDCVKMEAEQPSAVTSACGSDTGAATTGIRVWNGGGPEGSNWNVEGLTCSVTLQSGCEGATTVVMKVGSRELARAAFERREPATLCRFVLPLQSWEHELDAGEDLPFRTGICRVEAYQTCADPPMMLRAADHFVAGFAWGE
jgi:hypothetical protein